MVMQTLAHDDSKSRNRFNYSGKQFINQEVSMIFYSLVIAFQRFYTNLKTTTFIIILKKKAEETKCPIERELLSESLCEYVKDDQKVVDHTQKEYFNNEVNGKEKIFNSGCNMISIVKKMWNAISQIAATG